MEEAMFDHGAHVLEGGEIMEDQEVMNDGYDDYELEDGADEALDVQRRRGAREPTPLSQRSGYLPRNRNVSPRAQIAAQQGDGLGWSPNNHQPLSAGSAPDHEGGTVSISSPSAFERLAGEEAVEQATIDRESRELSARKRAKEVADRKRARDNDPQEPGDDQVVSINPRKRAKRCDCCDCLIGLFFCRRHRARDLGAPRDTEIRITDAKHTEDLTDAVLGHAREQAAMGNPVQVIVRSRPAAMKSKFSHHGSMALLPLTKVLPFRLSKATQLTIRREWARFVSWQVDHGKQEILEQYNTPRRDMLARNVGLIASATRIPQPPKTMPNIFLREEGGNVPYELSCIRGDKLTFHVHNSDEYQSVVVELETTKDSTPAASPLLLEIPNLEGGSAITFPKARHDLVFVCLSHYAAAPFPCWWFIPNSLDEDLTPFVSAYGYLIRGEHELNHLYEKQLSMGYAHTIRTNDELMHKLQKFLSIGGYIKDYFHAIMAGQLEVEYDEETGMHSFTSGPEFDASVVEREDDPLAINSEQASRHSTPKHLSFGGLDLPAAGETPSGRQKPGVKSSGGSSSGDMALEVRKSLHGPGAGNGLTIGEQDQRARLGTDQVKAERVRASEKKNALRDNFLALELAKPRTAGQKLRLWEKYQASDIEESRKPGCGFDLDTRLKHSQQWIANLEEARDVQLARAEKEIARRNGIAAKQDLEWQLKKFRKYLDDDQKKRPKHETFPFETEYWELIESETTAQINRLRDARLEASKRARHLTRAATRLGEQLAYLDQTVGDDASKKLQGVEALMRKHVGDHGAISSKTFHDELLRLYEETIAQLKEGLEAGGSVAGDDDGEVGDRVTGSLQPEDPKAPDNTAPGTQLKLDDNRKGKSPGPSGSRKNSFSPSKSTPGLKTGGSPPKSSSDSDSFVGLETSTPLRPKIGKKLKPETKLKKVRAPPGPHDPTFGQTEDAIADSNRRAPRTGAGLAVNTFRKFMDGIKDAPVEDRLSALNDYIELCKQKTKRARAETSKVSWPLQITWAQNEITRLKEAVEDSEDEDGGNAAAAPDGDDDDNDGGDDDSGVSDNSGGAIGGSGRKPGQSSSKPDTKSSNRKSSQGKNKKRVASSGTKFLPAQKRARRIAASSKGHGDAVSDLNSNIPGFLQKALNSTQGISTSQQSSQTKQWDRSLPDANRNPEVRFCRVSSDPEFRPYSNIFRESQADHPHPQSAQAHRRGLCEQSPGLAQVEPQSATEEQPTQEAQIQIQSEGGYIDPFFEEPEDTRGPEMAVFDHYAQEFFRQAPANHCAPRVIRTTMNASTSQARQPFRGQTGCGRTFEVPSSSSSEETEDFCGSTFRVPVSFSTEEDQEGNRDSTSKAAGSSSSPSSSSDEVEAGDGDLSPPLSSGDEGVHDEKGTCELERAVSPPLLFSSGQQTVEIANVAEADPKCQAGNGDGAIPDYDQHNDRAEPQAMNGTTRPAQQADLFSPEAKAAAAKRREERDKLREQEDRLAKQKERARKAKRKREELVDEFRRYALRMATRDHAQRYNRKQFDREDLKQLKQKFPDIYHEFFSDETPSEGSEEENGFPISDEDLVYYGEPEQSPEPDDVEMPDYDESDYSRDSAPGDGFPFEEITTLPAGPRQWEWVPTAESSNSLEPCFWRILGMFDRTRRVQMALAAYRDRRENHQRPQAVAAISDDGESDRRSSSTSSTNTSTTVSSGPSYGVGRDLDSGRGSSSSSSSSTNTSTTASSGPSYGESRDLDSDRHGGPVDFVASIIKLAKRAFGGRDTVTFESDTESEERSSVGSSSSTEALPILAKRSSRSGSSISTIARPYAIPSADPDVFAEILQTVPLLIQEYRQHV